VVTKPTASSATKARFDADSTVGTTAGGLSHTLVLAPDYDSLFGCLLRASGPISRSQWNGGFGTHTGPSRGAHDRPASRPLRPYPQRPLMTALGPFVDLQACQ
jgi:hypothetical protein